MEYYARFERAKLTSTLLPDGSYFTRFGVGIVVLFFDWLFALSGTLA